MPTVFLRCSLGGGDSARNLRPLVGKGQISGSVVEIYSVKGSTIWSKIEFVRARFGDPAAAELEERFSAHQLNCLVHAGWYPHDLYVEVLEYIAQTFYSGDLTKLRDVGAFSAEAALTKVYQNFSRGRNFVAFLKRMARLHQMFYSHGELTVEIDEQNLTCDIRPLDKPRVSEADLCVACGFYEECARLHGAYAVTSSYALGPMGARISLSWS